MERIQKIIAQAGIASRRKAEEFIEQKRVMLNGNVAKLGDKATLNDEILLDGRPIVNKEEKVYFMINKPESVVCTLSDPQGRTVITDLIDTKLRIFPVGRLDYDTTGTLLLTNDGELSHRLTHPSYNIMRTYRARITRPLTKEELDFLNGDDVIINNKPSKQEVKQVDTKSYTITLNVGTYHHVKLLFELFGAEVLQLTRIEFAGLTHVGNLQRGEYKRLNVKEIRWLKQLVGMI